ncbi:MAG: YciI family protein [Thermoleophilia bacterium]|nr:YciI family protein [Thermoleophilia bacterium]
MRYMLLIYTDGTGYPENPTPEQVAASMEPWFAYGRKWASVIEAGEPLQRPDSATTIRLDGGKPVMTDGPFAETREQLGGYYIFECETLDEALEAAAECPGLRHGSVELRPIMDMPEPPR